MVTYTNNKKLNKPANGEFPDTWDVPVNQDWDIIDKALGSAVTFTVGASDITLTISDAQNQRIVLTGTPGASRYIIIPFQYLSAVTAVGGMWVVDNQTNADQYVITEVSGSVGVTVATGRKALVYSDGTDVKFADEVRLIAGTGISVSGSTVSLSTPVSTTNGGTGISNPTAGSVLVGNGSSALSLVAPGANGNVLTSNGSTWTSAAPTGGGGSGITSLQMSGGTTGFLFTPSPLSAPGGSVTMSGTLAVTNGGTGATTLGTGLLRGNGTGAITTSATVNLSSEVTNTLGVTNGGTGTTTATGTGSVVRSDAPTFTGNAGFSTLSASGAISASQLNLSGTLVTFGGSPGTQYLVASGGVFSVYLGTGLFSADSTNFSPSRSLLVIGSGSTTTNLSGAWVVYSDERTKKDILPYPKAVDAIDSLNPVTFKYNGQYGVPDDNQERVGLIAQDVLQSELPELIYTVPYKDPNTGQVTQIYQLNPGPLVYTLINAVKELDARVKALEAKVGP